ncbi:MAG: DUF2868 domain-containing protein [Burkholderiales bacterium]|nr:MAG: DUF2868 domain-containing protein [Burkholderiales bacterium]
MTENDARNALLVRAIETAPAGQVAWSDDDRAWANRAAAEVEGEGASSDVFIARRAQLAAERLSSRERSVRRALRALEWRPWVGWALALAAFAMGAASDAIGGTHRVNVLAPPLLALMAWNILVYAAIGLRAFASLMGRKPRPPGPAARLIARAAHAAGAQRLAGADAPALVRFASDWAQAGANLNASRIARVLHVAAIAVALGALAGLYVRGLGLEYRAGWESTFLDAASVRRVLDFVLGPASWLTGMALPDASRLEAMRFPASTGEPAGPWIHLHAVTVALVVVLPRLLLAIAARLREHRLATRFPVSLDDAYFSALARAHRGEAASVAVVPCGHQPTPQATLGLRAMLGAVLGSPMNLAIAAPVAYGDEDSAAVGVVGTARPTLVVALLSSTATPEADAHGAFVDALSAALPAGASLLVLVDESGFVARFGDADATAARRRDERRLAWKRFFAARERHPLIVDLERTAASTAERALREALDRLSGHPMPQATT